MKKIKLLVMVVLLTSVFSIGAYAQTDEASTSTMQIGNTILQPFSSSSSMESIAYISDSITDAGGQKINISSSTYATTTCENLKLVIYLQKYSNGSWSTVKSYTYNAYNTSSISKDILYSGAESGGSYRVKTYHYATLDGTTTLQSNTTNSITMN